MGKKNRKGKENNAAKTSFLIVENIKNTNSGLELPSQDYTNVEEKESSPKTDFPLITKEHVNTKTDSNILDYPTIGDLVSSVEKLCVLKELKIAFPEVDDTLIKAILIASQGVLEPAFNSLLYYSSPEENTDFALPMKPISVEDYSKINVSEILQREIFDDIEDEVSGQGINGSMVISKIESELSSLAEHIGNISTPGSNREVAESTRNVAVAEGHNTILSNEDSILKGKEKEKEKEKEKGEEKGVNSLKGAAVKVVAKSLKNNRIPVTVKRNEPSNNLFDVLNCDESEEEEEQDVETNTSNQERKNQGGNTEVPEAQRDSADRLPAKDDGGYKSAFGTDSCGLFAADAKDEKKQVHPSRQELSFT